jgi:hypothetical protein
MKQIPGSASLNPDWPPLPVSVAEICYLRLFREICALDSGANG